MEINDLCGVFLLYKRNRIRVFEILSFLKYKEPILFKDLTFYEVRVVLKRLFPCHRNNKIRTKYFKISKKKMYFNISSNSLIYRPVESINIKIYGTDEKYFKKS